MFDDIEYFLNNLSEGWRIVIISAIFLIVGFPIAKRFIKDIFKEL